MDEKKLVNRAKHGDAEAFAALYERIYKKLYQFAFYTLRNSQDAEDVVGDTVLDAYASIRRLKAEEAFSSWMFHILSNKCKQKMREYYRLETPLEAAARDEERLRAEQPLEEKLDVRQTFFELKDEERLIIGMHLFFGYRTREIAEAMQMNENTVRSKESRALKKMGERLRKI